MTDILTPIHANGTRLTAPTRNRYFYGKLLDAHNLDMEQQYFLEMGRMINRLTLGSGVLCGLHVKPGKGKTQFLVSPGVAVDGEGREIMVTEQVTVDLASLEGEKPFMLDEEQVDPAPEPTPAPTPAPLRGMVLCLSYHECDVEPTPVLVADCDLREECVPGAVRERFKFTLMSPEDAPLPEDPCSIMRGAARSPWSPAGGEVTHQAIEKRLLAVMDEHIEFGPRAGPETATTAAAMRHRLCSVFHPPCAAGSACVPIALIGKGRTGLVVEECLPRRTIYSNAVLLDLILCLAEQMEECCGRKITVSAPKLVEAWPSPPTPADPTVATEVKLGDFDARLKQAGGAIALSFDRDMNLDRLKTPDEWLRVFMLPETDAPTIGLPVPLQLVDPPDSKTLSGAEGQTAIYKFGPLKVVGGGGGLGALKDVGPNNTLDFTEVVTQLGGAWVLVLARSDSVTQIAAADDAELLDADFYGTSLTTEMTDLLWELPIISTATGSRTATLMETPPDPMPTLPSGNAIEGGVFHYSFHVTP
jgi:hypothetical protein